MLSILANCRHYVDSACSFEKLTISSKNLPVEGTEGAYCGIQISARNSFLKQRIVGENDKIIFRNLEWQFVSKVDVQETPYKCKPKFAPRLIIQICARSALSLITWLFFFWRGKGKAKLMEDGAQQKLYEYKFKFASKPYHANLRTKQIVIDIMKLFENWGSKFFRRCYPSPF